jgi:PIN domain nuclease of toxin-antitoxin system
MGRAPLTARRGQAAVILLDTQSLLWLAFMEARFGRDTQAMLQESMEPLSCSAISFWEMAMLVDKRRIALSSPLDQWIQQARRSGLSVADVSAEIGIDAGSLPGDIHGDPADRIIIATARALNCPLLTADRAILDYAAQGHVRAIDASR